MHKTIHPIIGIFLSKIVVRNTILLAAMSALIIIFLIRPIWASEILLVFGCEDIHFTPPGLPMEEQVALEELSVIHLMIGWGH